MVNGKAGVLWLKDPEDSVAHRAGRWGCELRHLVGDAQQVHHGFGRDVMCLGSVHPRAA